jgi:hypothetical protein
MSKVVCDYPSKAWTTLQVLICGNCVFWCGCCSGLTGKGKNSINRLDSSLACSRFSNRELVKSAFFAQNIPHGGKV